MQLLKAYKEQQLSNAKSIEKSNSNSNLLSSAGKIASATSLHQDTSTKTYKPVQ
jgi:hypothetical protein